MVIEQLIYSVRIEDREEFRSIDESVWYPFLPQQAGFVDKQYWVNQDKPNEITITIYWQNQISWDNVSKEENAAREKVFGERSSDRFRRISVIRSEVLE